MKMIKYVALALLLMGAAHADDEVCYEPYGADIEAEYESDSLLITVNWYDSIEELQEAIGEEDTEAISECEVHPDRDIGWCEIWVVRPTKVLGDPNMDALGHEVLHGLWGDYHIEY